MIYTSNLIYALVIVDFSFVLYVYIYDMLLVISRLNKRKPLTYSINFTIEREREGNTYLFDVS